MLPAGYAELLEGLKADIRTTRVRAAVAANRELIALYWRIGRAVVERQTGKAWGTRVLERLAADLRRAFPGVAGFSRANLFRIRAFYLAWASPAELPAIVAQPVRQLPEDAQPPADQEFSAIVSPAVANLPWGHNVVLLQRVKDPVARRWYAEAAVEHGWSRTILELQIQGGLHARQGRAVTNFARVLPAADSDLAQQTLKDPFLFDFLTLEEPARERELERGLVAHVDLKAGPFQPEYAGKLNFYLSAVDDLLRHPDDRPSIGLLLCRTKNRTTVEYALRDVNKPIGVADWEAQLVAALGLLRERSSGRVQYAVGLSPKTLGRALRFRHAVREIERVRAGGRVPVTWTAIAFAAGYADQSHLIREFNELAGVTPARYMAERRDVGFVQYGGGESV